MTDIVERLRTEPPSYGLIGDAAIEIEQLREALRNVPKTIVEAADEIERLRDQEVKMTNHAIDRMAEIERLRAALKYYADKKENDWKGGDDGVIARAALKESE